MEYPTVGEPLYTRLIQEYLTQSSTLEKRDIPYLTEDDQADVTAKTWRPVEDPTLFQSLCMLRYVHTKDDQLWMNICRRPHLFSFLHSAKAFTAI